MKRIAILLFVAACGSSSPGTPDAAVADAAPSADAMPSPDGRTDAYDGTVTDATGGAAIVGAKVCVLDHPSIACSTTDATGAFEIVTPDLQGQAIAIEATATGYLGSVALETEPVDKVALHTTITPSFVLSTDARAMAELSTQAGFTFPGEGTGFVLVRVDGATAGQDLGATISISPKSGKGPVYYDSNGPNPALTASTKPGAALFGDVAPGRYTITVTAPQKTCTVSPNGTLFAGDWAPGAPGTTDVQVAADAETLGVFVTCL